MKSDDIDLRHVDWQAVLADCEHLEMTRAEVAARVLGPAAVRALEHPAAALHRLAWLWSHLTGKPVRFLPKANRSATAAVINR